MQNQCEIIKRNFFNLKTIELFERIKIDKNVSFQEQNENGNNFFLLCKSNNLRFNQNIPFVFHGFLN